MPGDYYGGDDEGAMDKPAMGGPDKGKPKQEEDEGEALLPKSFFKGEVAPGHKCTVEVTHVGEDQCVVKYVDSGSEEEAPESEMSRANSKMSSMATEG